MPLRQSARFVLHLLLVVALAVPGGIAPAQAVADLLPEHAAASVGDMPFGELPCDQMGASAGDAAPEGDCRTPHDCDFSACLGTSCLPELPRMVAGVPAGASVVPWRQPELPAGVIDTPLRPPIA